MRRKLIRANETILILQRKKSEKGRYKDDEWEKQTI